MVNFVTENDAKVMVNPSSFENVMRLKNSIFKAAKKEGMDFNAFTGKKSSEIEIDSFFELAMAIDSDTDVNDALMACLLSCTYNSEKITPKTFEPVKARQDYYPVVLSCLRENLTPFFKGLISVLKEVGQQLTKESPKSP